MMTAKLRPAVYEWQIEGPVQPISMAAYDGVGRLIEPRGSVQDIGQLIDEDSVITVVESDLKGWEPYTHVLVIEGELAWEGYCLARLAWAQPTNRTHERKERK